MLSAREKKPSLEVLKGAAVPLSSAHRELVQMFIDYLRRLPELGRNRDGVDEVRTGYTQPYSPLIALLLNHFSVRDHGPSDYATKYDANKWDALPSDVRRELFEWFHAARFSDAVTERRRAVLDAEQDRRRAGEVWNDYVEAREKLGLRPAEAPWNLKGSKK